jgi:rod shape determining protein RodA
MKIYYGITAALLLAVLFIGIGKNEWGSSSWIDLGFISFQPSEFAKAAFIFMTAVYLEKMTKHPRDIKDIRKLLGYSIVPIILIILEPDAGTAMVYVFVYAVMLFIYGMRYRYIFGAVGLLAALSPIIYFFVLQDYQKARILALIFPGSDSLGSTYQVDNAFMAIGSGGWFGKGLYKGVLTQSGAIPVRESDFIFAVIGEELGFIGAMIFIVLIIFIIYRAVMISRNAPDKVGSLIAGGIAAMYAFNFFVNIGMTIGLIPVSGLPLPFVSSGGTAMISNFICIGLLLSISLRRKRSIFIA